MGFMSHSEPTSVPDQSHIDRVREALWQRPVGRASVMVGSGFSKGAKKIRLGAADPPTWSELGKEMSKQLLATDDRESRPESAPDPPPDPPPKLAQKYEAAFERSGLNHFLQQQIRDDDFRPGDKHTRLLNLPWHDVFTTNWDTLLERTQVSVQDRTYSVVRNKAEIPPASQPRIIKLHGSFPAQKYPLIVTEEDYRTYPKKFAPFVNTVQQAMMETVFLLIGFSGDDLNFKCWSGWIRDHLEISAPRIYLAGYLNLSSNDRRTFERQNTFPIDLAGHPKAGEWPRHLCHDYATEWILHTLERGRPYDVTDWPSRRQWPIPNVPDRLQPVIEVDSDEPKREPNVPQPDSGDLPNLVRQTIEVWSHNRRIYPGWLAVPAIAQHRLHWSIREWEPLILKALPDLASLQRLDAIRELVWHREILLEPISPQLESAAEETLKLIDCQNRTIDGIAVTGIEWGNIREAWRAVALALVTVARHNFNQGMFNQRIEALSSFLSDDPDVAQRIRHERCLWAIYSMDYEELESLLKGWQTENDDPVWMMRKAAILAETDQTDDAEELFERALSIIRESPDDGRSVAGPSQEGWALLSVRELGFKVFLDGEDPYSKRWRELAPLKCDAFSERDEYANVIEARDEYGYEFSHNWRVPAHRAIRLSEVAGLPPVFAALHILHLATDDLLASEPEMASRLVLRIATSGEDSLLQRILSRTRVATMSVDLAKTLAEICKGAIDYTLSQRVGAGGCARDRMPVAMEALSQLVSRLKPDMVEAIFDKALECYQSRPVAQESGLENPVRNLLQRSWEALPEDRRTARVLDLLSLPIVGIEDSGDPPSRYPDPGEFLQDDHLLPPIRTGDNEGRWQEIVNLIVRGLIAGGEARKRASRRLASVALWEQLKEDELQRVAQALWSKKHIGPDNLPGGTPLFDWVFLLLPEPKLGLAERRFRRKWLATSNTPQENAPSPDIVLYQVGAAISNLKLDLSEDERCYLAEVVKKWLGTPEFSAATNRALVGLPSILAEVTVPKATGEKLFEKLQSLNESDNPGLELIPGLAKAIPHRLDELVSTMRMGLASDKANLATSALQGLSRWLAMSYEEATQVQSPPDDLVREIGVIIAARRKASLEKALEIAKWVFDDGSDEHRESIAKPTLDGLGYLAEELRYDRAYDQDSIKAVPRLRRRCAQLVLSMKQHGYQDDPVVTGWLKIIKDDPLPEVRYARGPVLARQPEDGESMDDDPNSHAE